MSSTPPARQGAWAGARAARIRPWVVPDVAAAATPRAPPPAETPPVPAVAPPRFTAAELEAACEQGREEGVLLAQQAQAARRILALEQIAATMREAAADALAVAELQAQVLAGVLVRALAASFPALEAQFGPPQVAALARALLPGLAREPAVSIRVAPGGLAALAAEIASLPQAQSGIVGVEADPALGDADIRIAWRDGTAVRDGAAIRAEVLAALGGIAGIAETEGSKA